MDFLFKSAGLRPHYSVDKEESIREERALWVLRNSMGSQREPLSFV